MKDDTGLKRRLHTKCMAIVKERLANAQAALQNAHESMMGETKSSAGDKFETSRAMLQGEQDRMKTVIIKTKELEYQLSQVPIENHTVVSAGSLIYTEENIYYLSVGIGKVLLDDAKYFALSLASPLGRLLSGKQSADRISINGKEMVILDVR